MFADDSSQILQCSMSGNPNPTGRLLIDGFLESARNFPEHPALDVDDQVYTYSELAEQAGAIAAAIGDSSKSGSLAGVMAHKSLTGFAGILGSLISGRAYVPLQPHHPIERTRRSIEAAELDVIVAGTEAIESLVALLPAFDRAIVVIVRTIEDALSLQSIAKHHRVVCTSKLVGISTTLQRPDNSPDDLAYLIFTSGSTGLPKGVPVRNSNVVPFVQYMSKRTEASPDDRFSQISDLTFDLSIFPIWTCWENGARLCCVSEKARLAPAKFVKEKRITVWTSVPSAIVMLKRMRLLKTGAFPSVRYSFFCGEPLPAESVKSWQAACPNSIIDNMYGPTEATCAFTQFRWTGDDSRCANGIVPIGWPFETQHAAVVDKNLEPVTDCAEGELCLAGTQVVDGYLKDLEKTNEKFVVIPSLGGGTWYRTGDLAVKASDGCYFFRGRTDYQVKVFGHRIELQEIEHAIRDATESDMAVCVPWPIVDGAAQGLVGFVAGAKQGFDESSVLKSCESVMPEYMVPKRIHFLSSLPLNTNGKVDRVKLANMLQEDDLR